MKLLDDLLKRYEGLLLEAENELAEARQRARFNKLVGGMDDFANSLIAQIPNYLPDNSNHPVALANTEVFTREAEHIRNLQGTAPRFNTLDVQYLEIRVSALNNLRDEVAARRQELDQSLNGAASAG